LDHSNHLNYLDQHRDVLVQLMAEDEVRVSATTRWHLHLGDFRDTIHDPSIPAPHAILYDPYSPATNPEMWTLDHLRQLRARLRDDTPCLLTNYTRSTAVRVALLLAGFYVGIGCAVGEKEETTVASNVPELIKQPLEKTWLARVKISTNAAPLRAAGQGRGPISEADFATLSASPQFL
jgi:hypothetical protein